jgi:hypothetical protein
MGEFHQLHSNASAIKPASLDQGRSITVSFRIPHDSFKISFCTSTRRSRGIGRSTSRDETQCCHGCSTGSCRTDAPSGSYTRSSTRRLHGAPGMSRPPAQLDPSHPRRKPNTSHYTIHRDSHACHINRKRSTSTRHSRTAGNAIRTGQVARITQE